MAIAVLSMLLWGGAAYSCTVNPSGEGTIDCPNFGIYNNTGFPDYWFSSAIDLWMGAVNAVSSTDMCWALSNSPAHSGATLYMSNAYPGFIAVTRSEVNVDYEGGKRIAFDILFTQPLPTLSHQGSFSLTPVWSALPGDGGLEIGCIATHELGHALGLDDSGGCSISPTQSAMTVGWSLDTSTGAWYHPCLGQNDWSTLFTPETTAISNLYTNWSPDLALVKCPSYNSDALVSDFSVAAGVAYWTSSYEVDSIAFRVQRATEPLGEWVTIADVTAVGPASYSVTLPTSTGFFRLVEEDRSGDIQVLTEATAGSATRMDPVPIEPNEEELRIALSMLEPLYGKRPTKSGGPAVLAYTSSEFVADYEAFVAEFWRRTLGATVTVVPVEPFNRSGQDLAEAIVGDIHMRIGPYYNRIDYVHLVGSAEPLLPGSETDLIPYFELPTVTGILDSGVMQTDVPYGDTNSDDVPDISVSRWPISNVPELLQLALKMQRHNLQFVGVSSPSVASILVNDNDSGGKWGEWAEFAGSQIEGILGLRGITTQRIDRSDYSTAEACNIAAIDLWNNSPSNLVFALGSVSGPSAPAMFFDQTLSAYPFSVSQLQWPGTSLMVLASCGGADTYDRTFPFGTYSVAREMMCCAPNAAISIIGPTNDGSWQSGNEVLARAFAEAVDPGLGATIAETFLQVQRAVMLDTPPGTRAHETALSYSILGDPLSTLEPQIPLGSMPDLGELFLTADSTSVVDQLQVGVLQPFTFFLVVDADFAAIGQEYRNAENEDGGLLGFEAGLEIPSGVYVTSASLRGGNPIDFGVNDNFRVGMAGPVEPLIGGAVLVQFDCLLLQPAQDLVITLGPTVPGSFVDEVTGSAPGWVCEGSEMYRFAEGWRDASLIINPSGTLPDIIPPTPIGARVAGAERPDLVHLAFDEPITDSALATSNYQILDTLDEVWTSVRAVHRMSDSAVLLELADPATELTPLRAIVSNVSDIAENVMANPVVLPIADPRVPPQIRVCEFESAGPGVGAAQCDWFEVVNIGGGAVDISGWTFSDDGAWSLTLSTQQSIVIDPWEHLLFARTATPLQSVGVSVSFEVPDLYLAYQEDVIVIRDRSGYEVDRVAFEGGWPAAFRASRQWSYQGDNDDPGQWRAAGPAYYPDATQDYQGTPGNYNIRATGVAPPLLPQKEGILRAFPNPFNASVRISFAILTTGNVQLAIYDIRGREVAILIDEAVAAGVYQEDWDGRDQSGNAVSSGMYFATLESGGGRSSQKIMLVK